MSLPEAWESLPGHLPHQHRDWRSRFPRAICDWKDGDDEPTKEDLTEEHGSRLGARRGRPITAGGSEVVATNNGPALLGLMGSQLNLASNSTRSSQELLATARPQENVVGH